MRNYFFALLLALLPMSATYADVATIKQALKDGKTVKEVIKEAVDNGEELSAVLNDLIAVDPSQAYQAIRTALVLYPKQKAAILSTGEALGLDKALMLSPLPAPATNTTNPTTQQLQQNTKENFGVGGSDAIKTFIPVNIINTPFPSNTGGNSVGGDGCTDGTSLIKNPATGISSCASPS